MNISGHNRPFWRRKANKVITYDITGQDDQLYVTNKRNTGRRYSRGENIDPSFRSYEKGGNLQYEEGYLVKRGESPANKVNILRPQSDSENYDYDGDDYHLTQTMPNRDMPIFKNQTLLRSVNEGHGGRKHSPLKREVAKKFVNVLEDLGNYDFNIEDIRSQEEMMEKLHFVQSGIKNLKGNIREYSGQPFTNFNATVPHPVQLNMGTTSNIPNSAQRVTMNANLKQENHELKEHLKSTEEQEEQLTKQFENVMRSPVKEADAAKIQILIAENQKLMEKAEEYVRISQKMLIPYLPNFREHSIWITAKSCKALLIRSSNKNLNSGHKLSNSSRKFSKIKIQSIFRNRRGQSAR